MNSFTPIFETILDSSVWEEPYYLRVLWTALLVLKDPDHVVRSSAFKIAKRSNMKEEEVIKGLKVLSEPDPRRIEHQEWEGRRIQKVEGGWLILNGQKYEDEMRAVSRRMYKARKAREYRERAKEPARHVVQAAIKPEVARDRRAVAKLPAPAPLPQAATEVEPEAATVPSLSRAAVKAEAERLRAQFQEQVEGQPGAQNGDDEEIPFGPEAGNPDNPEDYQ